MIKRLLLTSIFLAATCSVSAVQSPESEEVILSKGIEDALKIIPDMGNSYVDYYGALTVCQKFESSHDSWQCKQIGIKEQQDSIKIIGSTPPYLANYNANIDKNGNLNGYTPVYKHHRESITVSSGHDRVMFDFELVLGFMPHTKPMEYSLPSTQKPIFSKCRNIIANNKEDKRYYVSDKCFVQWNVFGKNDYPFIEESK